MTNKFQNLFRFVDISDTVELAKSFYAPKSRVTPLPAVHGDAFRFLVPKSDVNVINHAQAKICLVKNNAGTYEVVAENIGVLRPQETEFYTEIKVMIRAAPGPDDYRQLALIRQDSTTVFGTFTSQESNLELYCSAVRDFWQSYPYASVFVEQNGCLLTIRAYHTPTFILENEKIQVGVGQVDDYNTNTPSIIANSLGTIVKPATDSYLVSIGSDIQEGNIFSLNGVFYEVKKGDTETQVRQALLSGAQRIEVAAGTAIGSGVEVGSRIVKNAVKPIVTKAERSSDATYTYWRISVSGKITPGNYIEISASGATTVRVTATTASTISTLETALNTNVTSGGTFRAPNGSQVIITVLPGTQELVNTNSPLISMSDKQTTAEQTLDRYQIVVASSVQEGNVFYLMDKSYTAKLGDTNESVALALGGEQSAFILEVNPLDTFVCYALKGKKYNERHALDAEVIEQPVVRRSQQYVCELKFPSNQTGIFHVGVVNDDTGDIVSLSNAIDLRSAYGQTSIVEVGGREEFGFEYYERMLTQRARLHLHLNTPTNRVESSSGAKLGGSIIRMNTKIMRQREFVTTALSEESADALAAWMQHRNLIVNGEPYLQIGAYSEDALSEGLGLRQLSGVLESLSEKNNFPNLLQGFFTDPYGSAIISGHGLQIYAQSGSFVRRLSAEWQLLNVAEYEIGLQAGADNVKLSIFRNGLREASYLVEKNKRAKLSSFLRVNAHDKLMFDINIFEGSLEVAYQQQTDLQAIESVTYITEESQNAYVYKQYSDDYNDEHKN